MKRHLTYGLLLLTILASHFVVSACQEDLPETTEVMMTFTTRAVVTQGNESDAINIEKMNDLRVIVVRENGDIVYNDTKQVGGESTATVSFQTPVKTGGENFKFFAIANYSSLVNAPNWANVNINNLITHEVGNGSEISISSPIPQTKYWEYPVKQLLNEIQSITKQLDFLASKISVQFINTYDAAQTLSNIHITGITPNGKGRLFNRPTGEKDDKGEEIYEEVYVTENSDVTLNEGKINFETITVNAATNEEGVITPTPSAIQHYYTYPVDAGNITVDEGNNIYPTLHATWNKKTYELPLKGITELKRNDHLKIIVTLTGHALTINYSIAPWVEEPTNIGSPTTNGDYQVGDWGNGNDIIIGGEIGGGDTPGGGEDPGGNDPGGETPIGGSILWSGTETLNWSDLPIYCEKFNDLAYEVTTSHKIRISFNSPTNNATLQFKYGVSDANFAVPELTGSNNAPINNGTTSFDFTLTQEMLENFLNKEDSTVAFYVRSDVLTITEVLLYLPETE